LRIYWGGYCGRSCLAAARGNFRLASISRETFSEFFFLLHDFPVYLRQSKVRFFLSQACRCEPQEPGPVSGALFQVQGACQSPQPCNLSLFKDLWKRPGAASWLIAGNCAFAEQRRASIVDRLLGKASQIQDTPGTASSVSPPRCYSGQYSEDSQEGFRPHVPFGTLLGLLF